MTTPTIPPPPPAPRWRTWAGSVGANWRTSAAALVVAAGLEVAVSHIVGLPAGLTHVCELVERLGIVMGLLAAADAQRLAALEAAIEKLGSESEGA